MSAHGRGATSRAVRRDRRLQETCKEAWLADHQLRSAPSPANCADGGAVSLAVVGGHSQEEIPQENSPGMAHRWSAHLSKYGRGARTTDAEKKNKRDMAPSAA